MSRGSALRAGRLVGSHCDSGHRASLSTQDERHGSQGEAGPSREGGDLCDVLGRGCWAPIPARPRERGARLSPPPPMPGVVAAKALSAAHGAPRSLPLHAGRLGAVWCLLTNLVTGLVKCGRNTAPVTDSPRPRPLTLLDEPPRLPPDAGVAQEPPLALFEDLALQVVLLRDLQGQTAPGVTQRPSRRGPGSGGRSPSL